MKFKIISNKAITISTECHYCSCIYTIKDERSFLSRQMWVHISHVAVVTQYLITVLLSNVFSHMNIFIILTVFKSSVLSRHFLLILQTEMKAGVRTSGIYGFAVMPNIRRAQRESLKMRRLMFRVKIHWQTSHNHLVNPSKIKNPKHHLT